MSKHQRLVAGVNVDSGSAAALAEQGVPKIEKLKVKAGLVVEIARAIRKQGLTQLEAGRRMGIAQPKVSAMLRGDFTNLSERKLMDCLNRLGYDIEIKVKPARRQLGHLTVALH